MYLSNSPFILHEAASGEIENLARDRHKSDEIDNHIASFNPALSPAGEAFSATGNLPVLPVSHPTG